MSDKCDGCKKSLEEVGQLQMLTGENYCRSCEKKHLEIRSITSRRDKAVCPFCKKEIELVNDTKNCPVCNVIILQSQDEIEFIKKK